MTINFGQQDITISFNHKTPVKKWIKQTIKNEGKTISYLNIIFCSDDFLLSMNRKYLQHDYYTDIISFQYEPAGEPLEGELYISIDRIKENAQNLGLSFLSEILRVIIHGVLHLSGYNDQTEEERITIKAKEDYYLNLLKKSGWDFT
jgi:probable rRNA maturation factor